MKEDYIDTDYIFKKIREFEKSKYEKPKFIKLNSSDVKYLQSNIGFSALGDMHTIMGMKVVKDERIQIGYCILSGRLRLKKW